MRDTLKGIWLRRSNDFWRLFRFGITGTLSSLIHYGVYCLAFLHFDYNVSYTAGYIVGLIFNYAMTTLFTFRQNPSKKNVAGFVASHILNYLLEIGLLNLFVWWSVSAWFAPILVMLFVVPINFIILRFVYISSK